jgi:ABC-2 type transport system permease protein
LRKIAIIASREYMAAVRTKAFIIGLVSMPVMMFGSAIVQTALRNQVDLSDKKVVIIDRTPDEAVAGILLAAAEQRNKSQIFDPETKKQTSARFVLEVVKPSERKPYAMSQQRLELSDRVRSKDLLGFLEVGAEALNPPPGELPALDPRGRLLKNPEDNVSVRYQTNSPLDDDLPRWAEKVIQTASSQRRLVANKISIQSLLAMGTPVPLVSKRLTSKEPVTGVIKDAADEGKIASFLAPAALAVLMLMMVLVGTTPLLQSVFEEKSARIAEVLLGSVRPFELMMGKLVGMVAVSLTTVVIYLAGGFWAANNYGFAEYLSPSLIGWFLLYQTISVLMFGSLFIAIGAACSDIKETQTLMTPVMLLVMIPMFALANIIERPSSPLATGLSYFPFATPIVMILRQSIPPGVPWWEPVLGIVGMLAMTTVCVYAAGRIFRVGLLMQGKGANFVQMAKWVIRG